MAIMVVVTMERGTVKAKTRQSFGEMVIIMTRDPATVTTEEAICTRSVDRVALMVSMS